MLPWEKNFDAKFMVMVFNGLIIFSNAPLFASPCVLMSKSSGISTVNY